VLLMVQNLLLVDGKIPIEDVEHLAFHPTDVSVLENAGTPRPNDVLHHLVVEVFASEYKSSNEDPLTCPAFGGYPEVGLRSLNIDQSDEHDCYADPGGADHPPHELSEAAVFLLAIVRCVIER